MEDVALSLVIPTIGRKETLEPLLDSLVLQTCKDFEVIIADQSRQPDEISHLLQKYQDALPIKHIPLLTQGAARARNAGTTCAEGKILGWPDDDCWYEKDVVENVLQLFSRDQVKVLLGCPLTEEGKLYNRRIPGNEKIVTIHDSLNFGIEWSIFMTKEVFNTAGGFDGRIGTGSGTVWSAGESSDLCLRIAAFEKGILYSPLVRVHHPQARSTTADSSKKTFQYAYGMGAIVRKNHLSPVNVLLYSWTYIRAVLWALARLNLKDVRYHLLRLRGMMKGYFYYPKDKQGMEALM